jgi:dipeptidyl aminopeptidase/acylaminoacyl peptidase
MMRTLAISLALLAGLAPLAYATSAHAQARREVGNLILDGVPEVPKRIGDRMVQYLSARGAALQDWDPDGRGLLISTRFGDTAQVHHVAMPGGDREQLTFFREPVTEAAYGGKRADRGFFFRMDSGGGEFYQYYWYERATGAHTLVTDGKSRNSGFRPANGGTRFAFASTLRNGKDFDLYVLDSFDGRSVKRVRECTGEWSVSDWSGDDSKLLIENSISVNESYLWVLDLASGKSTQLNPQPDKKIAYGKAVFARKSGGYYYSSDEDAEFLRLVYLDAATGKQEVLTPAASWDVQDLSISPDGTTLAYVANEGGTSGLYQLPAGVVSALKFDYQSRRIGFTLSTAQSPNDVYSVDVKTRKPTRWTASEVGGLNPSVFVTPELIDYPSFDGRTIHAWYYRPRIADEKHPVPVVVDIHGGPEGQATAGFNPITQYWVNELGIAVIAPNVRGSSGYGKTFLLLDNGVKREDSVKDVGHLLYWIGERKELDKKKVALYGGSYGGYMVLATLFRFPERVKCAVEQVGISNFVTFLEHTEAYRRDLRRAEYGDEREPDMRKHLLSIAPTTNAAKIKQPLFVAQGKNDPRVPVSEADQIVKTVRLNGGPVWYLVAKDEGHGFQKRTNRDAFQNAVSLFFEEFLLK